MSRSQQRLVPDAGLPDSEDRLLLDRARLALMLILGGVAAVFLAELLIYSGRSLVNAVQATNFIVVAVALVLLRDPARRSFNLAIGFTAFAVTIVSTGAVGVIADDAITPVVIMVGMSVVAATFVPWNAWWQFASVVVVAATAAWNVISVVPSPPLFWLQNVGSIAPTLAATVVICHVLRRQRAEIVIAQRERRSREENLRETNLRLEHEIKEHQRTEDRLRFAMRELDHRVKNTLAAVQSVAEQTLRASDSMNDFGAAFSGRIQAMARIHTALAGRRWEGLGVAELVELVVGPYRRHERSVSIDSDGTFVSSDVVRVLGMTLHELATNAAKYGALSVADGRLTVSCRNQDDDAARLHIRWTERNGPAVGVERPRGFGIRLIEEAIAYELDGRVNLQFLREGLDCDIEVPLRGKPR